jgi:hypothetical protein
MNIFAKSFARNCLIALTATSLIYGIGSCTYHKYQSVEIYNAQKPQVPDGYYMLPMGTPLHVGDYAWMNCGCSSFEENDWTLIENNGQTTLHYLGEMHIKYSIRKK